MMRTHVLIWTVLVAGAVGVLFHTSHQAGELESELEARHRAVIAEREAIRVLHAEWAYLNEPGRLRELARRHTPLGPAMPVQIIASPQDVPEALPGLGVLPGLPLPPRKPGPGAMVAVTPQTEPAAAPAVAPPPTVASRRPDAAPSREPLQALLANFRARQSTAQAGAGQ